MNSGGTPGKSETLNQPSSAGSSACAHTAAESDARKSGGEGNAKQGKAERPDFEHRDEAWSNCKAQNENKQRLGADTLEEIRAFRSTSVACHHLPSPNEPTRAKEADQRLSL